MSYSIKRLTNPSAYLVTLSEDFDLDNEVNLYYEELNTSLDSEHQPINIIVDMLNFKVTFDDLMNGLKTMMQLNLNPYRHQYANSLIMVTNNGMIKLSIDGVIKMGVANKMQVVKSVDEALDLC